MQQIESDFKGLIPQVKECLKARDQEDGKSWENGEMKLWRNTTSGENALEKAFELQLFLVRARTQRQASYYYNLMRIIHNRKEIQRFHRKIHFEEAHIYRTNSDSENVTYNRVHALVNILSDEFEFTTLMMECSPVVYDTNGTYYIIPNEDRRIFEECMIEELFYENKAFDMCDWKIEESLAEYSVGKKYAKIILEKMGLSKLFEHGEKNMGSSNDESYN